MTRIQIQQTPGAIEIESRAAQLRVLRSRKLALSIKQNRAQMNIERSPAKLHIDQTECFASSGLKTSLRLAGDFYRDALSAGLEAIASIAQEGLRFLRVEEGGNPIRDIAATRGVRMKQMSLRAMPSVGPSITFEPARIDVRWSPYSVDTSWDVVEGEVEFIPHQVSIRMNPYPSIEISAETGDGEKRPEDHEEQE